MKDTNSRKCLYVYYCGSEACEPGHSFGPAIRPHYLIHFIMNGGGSYQTGGQVYHLKAGDAFLIRPGDTTFYQADPVGPWTYTWAAFDGTEAEELLAGCGFTGANPVYLHEEDPQVRVLLGQLTECFFAPGHSQLELRGLLYLIFSRMVSVQPQTRPLLQQEYVDRACDYIEHNFGYGIKVADIAHFVGIDRTYLYKVFITVKGRSPQQFLLDKRLNEARNLLTQSTLNVTEVAYSCGFHDVPSFCRQFKAAEDCTPLEYRGLMKYSH